MTLGLVDSIILEDLQEACIDSYKIEPTLKTDFGIASDNLISLCPSAMCSSNSNGECDIKIFISWLGTDKNNNNLVSSGERFMNFQNYNLAGLYSTILATSNRNSTEVDEPFNVKTIDASVLGRIGNITKTA
jgi:hypothetical protein